MQLTRERQRICAALAGQPFPISGLMWMDWILKIHAPFCGEVLTLTGPLASYRIHDAQWNRYNHLSLTGSFVIWSY